MSIDIKVPVLAESIADATLLEWKRQPGEAVKRDEILIEIETDKVVLEVPAPQDGVLQEIVRGNGEMVVSEEVIARVDTDAAPVEVPPHAVTEDAVQSSPVAAAPPPAAGGTAGAAQRLSPAVRKLVTEHQIDPGVITGTGKDGRIIKGDVIAYIDQQSASQPPPAPPAPAPTPASPAAPVSAAPSVASGDREERRVPMTRIRARIAERLVEAQRTAAILTTFNEVNMQPVMELRKRYKETFEKAHGARLGFMSFFAKAAVLALKKFPAVNASVDGNDVVYHDYYDIGVAVGSPRGLVVPVLRDVDALSYADIEAKIAEFGEKAKSGQLSVDDLSGGTFTITNGGIFGSLLSTPILNPPQTGILGMHKIQERPMVEDGEVVVRPMMYVALSYDHRLIDGREAVQFLVTIKNGLEDPSRMLLEV